MKLQINPGEVRAAEYVVDRSKVADKLAQATKPKGTGRPPKWRDADRVFWIGLIVSGARGQTDTASVHRVLDALLVEDKIRIGFARVTSDPFDGTPQLRQMSVSILENVWKRYDRYLKYGNNASIEETEQQNRYNTVMDALEGTTRIFTDIFDTGSYAIDASGIWAWTNGRTTKPTNDLDAQWSVKTAKNGGEDSFFGYFLHAATAIPAKAGDSFVPPPVIGALDMTPAKDYDLVGVTLGLIDRIGGVREIAVDRLYSYSDVGSWFDQLQNRGIKQVIQLRSDEHGFTDSDGMWIGTGFVHCPAMPVELQELKPPTEPIRPRPSDEKTGTKEARDLRYEKKLAIYEAAMEKYHADHSKYLKKVEVRQHYVMSYVNQPSGPEGSCRVRCPARDGKLACARYLDGYTEAMMAGKPVVENPPDKKALDDPQCCTQTTVTIHLDDKRKHVQEHYHDSPEWKLSYNRRSTVEGAFGNIKNPNREDLRRGNHRATSITRATILTTAIAAAYNLRMTRNWYNNNVNRRAHRVAQAVKQLEQTDLLLDPEDEKLQLVAMGWDEYLTYKGQQ